MLRCLLHCKVHFQCMLILQAWSVQITHEVYICWSLDQDWLLTVTIQWAQNDFIKANQQSAKKIGVGLHTNIHHSTSYEQNAGTYVFLYSMLWKMAICNWLSWAESAFTVMLPLPSGKLYFSTMLVLLLCKTSQRK